MQQGETMLHRMNLNAPSFDKIVNGTKKIELRLYDDKRKQIALNDIIEFNKNDTAETVQRKVVGLLNFPNFDMMIDILPLDIFGHPTRNEVKEGVNKIYSVERQREVSVLGILINPL